MTFGLVEHLDGLLAGVDDLSANPVELATSGGWSVVAQVVSYAAIRVVLAAVLVIAAALKSLSILGSGSLSSVSEVLQWPAVGIETMVAILLATNF